MHCLYLILVNILEQDINILKTGLILNTFWSSNPETFQKSVVGEGNEEKRKKDYSEKIVLEAIFVDLATSSTNIFW